MSLIGRPVKITKDNGTNWYAGQVIGDVSEETVNIGYWKNHDSGGLAHENNVTLSGNTRYEVVA